MLLMALPRSPIGALLVPLARSAAAALLVPLARSAAAALLVPLARSAAAALLVPLARSAAAALLVPLARSAAAALLVPLARSAAAALLVPLFLLGATARAADSGVEVDALLARVGRDSVLLSDLERFADVERVLECAGVLKHAKPLPTDRKALLGAYIDEELFYQEARFKKTGTAGQIPLSVQAIEAKDSCRSQWLKLGELYSRVWKTDSHTREGESMLVRELEKRVLVEKFRHTEQIPDLELWKREVANRYPVKIYLE